jgi:type II secretory ATPase GspE/PulE/Tfp pilus assembly ATPase PilB-like protein
MSKKDLSYYINKNVLIIKCKKRAKELSKLDKINQKPLSQYKTDAAIELGFKNWFDLHNNVKKKCELEFDIVNNKFKTDFDNLLKDRLNGMLTDIHIEARNPTGRIRTRSHGILTEFNSGKELSYQYLLDFSNTILNLILPDADINLNDYNFSSGSGSYKVGNEKMLIRAQFVPAYPQGFDLVLRVDHSKLYENFNSLTSLGYSQSHIKQIMEATSKSSGCFIIGATTGGGKETTLRALANQLNKNRNKKIYSLENDVVYLKLDEGIESIHCPDNKEYDANKSMYKAATEEALKNDAEIIFIETIRDSATAKIIKESYQSALFIASFHKQFAPNFPERLNDFGISSDTIASPGFCHGFLSQKLIPVVCPHCSKDVKSISNDKDYEDYIEYLGTFGRKYPGVKLDNVRIRNRDGCSKCSYGIVSRTACAEVVVLDDNMRQLIKNDDLKGLRAYWQGLSDNNLLSDDMLGKTAHEHALSKMVSGLIDPLDVLNNFVPLK